MPGDPSTPPVLGSSRLRQISQPVDDLDAAVDFYVDVLGLQLVARFDPPGLAFFDLGETRLLLEKGDVGGSRVLYFDVDDIDAAALRLHGHGVELEGGDPHLIFADGRGQFGAPGEEEWMVFFRDPSGNLLALHTRRPPKP